MTRLSCFLAGSIVWLVLGIVDAFAATEPLLFHRGRILAGVDDSAGVAVPRWTAALLVHEGRVAAAGSLPHVESEARRLELKPRRVNLDGKYAMPGLCDAHGHVAGLGLALARLRFEGTTSAQQIAAMVGAAAKTRRPGEWIMGRGWDQNDWEEKHFPTRELLDHAAPDHPVWLRRVDGHAGWANSRALGLAGLTAATADPTGGKIHRLADGSPSGVLVDNAMTLVDRAVAPATREQTRAAILRAAEHCRSLGLTAVHDAGIDAAQVGIYRELAEAGRLPIRVFAMLSAATAMQPGMLPATKVNAGDGMFRVFGVKAYADGALGSRGAALLAPYSDDPGNNGLLVTTADTLELITRASLAAGYQMCTHAIGDRGNRVALEEYERAAGGADRLRGKRFRIEHAQVLALDDIARFARGGVIASVQPTHCTSDMPWAPARLGPARIEGAYAWRRLLATGVRLALGSDFPVESADPRLGIFAAITTQAQDGTPPAGFRPGEKLDVYEALRGFTADAAYAAFAEGEVGNLGVGMRADLTVWDRDLTRTTPAELLKARVVMTVVNGTMSSR
ncbi:MAG: amidohydrolase [Candidatus Eisenbacteria bacterium]